MTSIVVAAVLGISAGLLAALHHNGRLDAIISALMQGLAANQILSIQGILNGTCNFILTAMSEQGLPYKDVLAEAQKRGYAEADPTLDVDGTDAAHKLAILAQLAFGISVPLDKVPRRGIDRIDSSDIRYARELGYTIKLLAEAWFQPAPNSPTWSAGAKRWV